VRHGIAVWLCHWGGGSAHRGLAGKEDGMSLLGHHVELQHLPVLAVFLGVGIWFGWQVLSLVCKSKNGV
jgi:hypothetical protein